MKRCERGRGEKGGEGMRRREIEEGKGMSRGKRSKKR
jgi:hypothetical protein